MTSPAELANQVRAGIPDVITVHPPGECPYCDALAALSVLEARLEQAEKALLGVARISDEALEDGHPGIPEMARVHRYAVAALDALARGVVGETSG